MLDWTLFPSKHAQVIKIASARKLGKKVNIYGKQHLWYKNGKHLFLKSAVTLFEFPNTLWNNCSFRYPGDPKVTDAISSDEILIQWQS